MHRPLISLVLSGLAVSAPGFARAQPPPAPAPAPPPTSAVTDATLPEEALDQKLAIWRFDALGIEPELVTRLETLFRMELERLDKQPIPRQRDVDRLITGDARECTGEDKCLAAIGKKLGVDVILTGTVGQLGDNYVLTIKAVDVGSARTLQKIQSDPLRGQPDDLIEGVRVAAYRLLAPGQLHGALQVQTDVVGASVQLDGNDVGKTPLPNNGVLGKLALGKHHLRVADTAYQQPYEDDVEVHFQKVSPVVVHLVPSTQVIGTGKIERVERRPFYTRTWFIVTAGAVAIGLGAAIGYGIGHTTPCIAKPGPGGAGC
ncbi:MAG TPA: PEGA domain-containing protein [Kofleriaceae bacterium]|nr:PEGA domain-containing protein [Kofleriaceae bacterium]